MKRPKEKGLQVMRLLRTTKGKKTRNKSLTIIGVEKAFKEDLGLIEMLAITVEKRGTFV